MSIAHRHGWLTYIAQESGVILVVKAQLIRLTINHFLDTTKKRLLFHNLLKLFENFMSPHGLPHRFF